jgi:hypothetical protein
MIRLISGLHAVSGPAAVGMAVPVDRASGVWLGRTGIRPGGTVLPGNVLPAAGVPGFARRSPLSASCDPARVIRMLAIAVPDGAGKLSGGGDLAGT